MVPADVADAHDPVVPSSVADIEGGGGNGVLEVHDIAVLSQAVGVPVADLTGVADALNEDGAWYLPWPSTRAIAADLARRHPGATLEAVRRETARWRARALRHIAVSRNHWSAPTHDRVLELDEELIGIDAPDHAKRHAIIRLWAGAGEPTLAEQLETLHRSFDTLSSIAAAAALKLQKLRTNRARRVATELEEAALLPQRD
ncbi:hypothetical protein [Microbacterium sp. cx-59]|uniref:hypothetical protein n=1 Tax=Microbacterium sp. cx-59 TaxID=2891207 RepID=UPI001E5A6E35|nr:hypothetical protein [Microbacterium sp. cx-59]MCC4907321.1 hypothetical protein [Microbacterium sp. cx-59]